MKNKFNRCCCPTEPTDFTCTICYLDCQEADLAGTGPTYPIRKIIQTHPLGEEGHTGKVSGYFILNGSSDKFTVYFDFDGTSTDLETNPGTAVQFRRAANLTYFQVTVLAGDVLGSMVGTYTESFTVFNSSQTFFYCIHFDNGIISIVLTDGSNNHYYVSTGYTPSVAGGSVGYKLDGVTTQGQLSEFTRSASESTEKEFCPACLGVTCDPCCPEPAASGWAVSFNNIAGTGVPADPPLDLFYDTGLQAEACDAINGLHLLDAVGNGCRWKYVGEFSALGIQPVDYTIVFGGISDCFQIPFGYDITLEVVSKGGQSCGLRATLSILQFNTGDFNNWDNAICGNAIMGRWEGTGLIQEMCQGTHVLNYTYKNRDPFIYCLNIPDTLTVSSI